MQLTMDTYTRFGLVDLAGAINKVPSIPTTTDEPEPQVLSATGTDGGEEFAPMFARADGFASLSVATDGEALDDVDVSAEERKPLEKRALDNNCQHVSTTDDQFAGVAQLVEQGIHKPWVAGSSPATGI